MSKSSGICVVLIILFILIEFFGNNLSFFKASIPVVPQPPQIVFIIIKEQIEKQVEKPNETKETNKLIEVEEE